MSQQRKDTKALLKMSNEESNRITKESIQWALIELMKNMNYEKITVTAIVQKAGVSRTAYYRNYYDKEDVLKDLLATFISDITTTILTSKTNEFESAKLWFSFIRNNAEIYRLLLAANLERTIQKELTKIVLQGEKSENERLRLIMWSGAIYSLISDWFERGMLETPDEMAAKYQYIVGNIHNQL